MKKFYPFCLLLLFSFTSLTLAAQQLAPSIQWQKSLGGSKVDRAYTVIRTLDQGYLVVGESFSNDGNVTGHHGSTDSSDAWVVKLDTAGNIQWQQSYGGTRNDWFKDVLQVSNGDFICVGSSESDNGDVSGLHSYMNGATYTANSDLWVMRISATGTIKWSKLLGGTDIDNGQVLRKASDGGGYIVSGNSSSVDGNVTGNQGFSDIWLLKISETGALIWQRTYGNIENQTTSDLIVTSDGNYVISGNSIRSNRGGAAPCTVIYAAIIPILLKVSPTGDIIWKDNQLLPCGLPGTTINVYNLVELPSGTLKFLGNLSVTTGGPNPTWYTYRINPATGPTSAGTSTNLGEYGLKDPPYPPGKALGPHLNRLLPDSSILSCVTIDYPFGNGFDGSLTLINPKGNGITSYYRKRYGGSNTESFAGLEIINEQEYIAAGNSNSNNGDVSGNHGDVDCWIVKFSALNTIKGKVFIDNNGNGVKDATEPFGVNVYVESKKNSLVMGNTTAKNGIFINRTDTGTYSTTVILRKPYYTVTPAKKQSVFIALNKKDSFDFALVPIPGFNDLEINMQPLNRLRPGFQSTYRVNYSNSGTTMLSSTEVQFIKPPKMDYVSAIPAASQVNGDTITWNTGTLAPLDSGVISLTLKAQPLPGVDNGDRLAFYVQVKPFSADATPADNRDTIWQTARSSYDPNDKAENYDGTIYSNQVSSLPALDYTIRFQNTGTDTAFGIIIRDTLSDKLDPSTIQMVAASHAYTFTLKDNKYCTWTFNDIKLADSIINEPLSHGYISYRIKPQGVMAVGDSIANRASIYFDFNPGVNTNNQLTVVRLVAPAPPTPVVTGIKNSYCAVAGIQKGKITNLPLAGNGLTATVKLDATVLPVAADSTFSFNAGTVGAGTHRLLISFANSSGNDSILYNIIITGASTPDVNLTANITNIINLTDPIIITATNASGGGTAPKYSFAKDKGFTNSIQAESSSNTVTLQPNTLTVGTNKIYVQMKTSDTCYTSQTAIDSISIERSAVTGIIDVDFPNQVINVYPNPFAGRITISGLNTGKKYVITLSNAGAQKVYTQQFSNTSNAVVDKTGLQAGRYWLSIYDVKKNHIIGSVILIKE